MKMPITLLRRFTSVFFLALLAGCNSSSTSTGGGNAAAGVMIGLTDAPGDFVAYQVDVTSLTLTKADNSVVDTLPTKTRVDFAQYADLTEFLTAATVPGGVYTSATMTLDYSNADIEVLDQNNNIVQVPAADILDENGNPISAPVQVTVQLADSDRLTIAPGVPASMTVDFNLAASNDVVFNGSVPVVTVQPFVVADIDPSDPKPHRLRGALKSVDLQGAGFQLYLRPFFTLLTGGDNRFGSLTVNTDASTTFSVDQQSYQGAAGLNKLAALPTLSAVVVRGDVDPATHVITATEVLAGSSVPGGTLDALTGTVIARQADVLTVKGATLIRTAGSVTFNDVATVQLGAGTRVWRQFDAGAHTIDDISVGQRVTVLGTVTSSGSSPLAMDATGGAVHMKLTALAGTVVNTTPAFSMDLQSIDRRKVAVFDFSGTGSTSGDNADPAAYTIDPGTLSLASLSPSAPARVLGFVAPFGQVGGSSAADFEARTVVDLSGVKAFMAVNWNPVSASAFGTASTSSLNLNLNGTGRFHYVVRRGVVTDLVSGATAAVIQPRSSGAGLFFIRGVGGTVRGYLLFSNFAVGLASQLSNGAGVKAVEARGTFDAGTATLVAGFINVRLE